MSNSTNIPPLTDQAEKDLDAVKDQVWQLYEGLKAYKHKPNPSDKERLDDLFGQIQDTASLGKLCDTFGTI